MNFNDLFISNLLLSHIPKINTGHIMFDILCIIIAFLTITYFHQSNFKLRLAKFIDSIISNYDTTNKIVFSCSDDSANKRFRAIMFFISKQNNPSVKKLLEIVDIKFNSKLNDYAETVESIYRVDQSAKFIVDTNINGCIYYKEKEKIDNRGNKIIKEITLIELSSNKFKLTELQKWVNQRVIEYENFIRLKACDKQLFIEVSNNTETDKLEVFYTPWKSNVTFENRFFTNKEQILSKIKFFIDNPDWYKSRGIPYTLGFLLWGEPGCGKTGFIKALMNLTNKHGISVKLNNQFDMNKLKEIIYDDELCEDIIIPQENRILIFEDIDCMDSIVMDRDLKEQAKKDKYKSKKEKLDKDDDLDKDFKKIKKITKTNNFNNNLSYFLNILDGIQECPGRIIIMTTNKPDKLDKALIRPGRIDYNIHFTKATIKDINDIAKFYWDAHEIDNINPDNDLKYSHAEIVNMCRTSDTIQEFYNKLCFS